MQNGHASIHRPVMHLWNKQAHRLLVLRRRRSCRRTLLLAIGATTGKNVMRLIV